MKIISWNVNGIRAVLKKGFLDFLQQEDPDILCLQEVRANQDQVELELSQYHQYWNSAEKKGYSGTAIFTKQKPLRVFYGLNIDEHDQEGRITTLEFPEFFLVNVYTPNAKRELTRLTYRQQWDQLFLNFLKQLEQTKPVIFCGDLNVAHQEIDLTNPRSNFGNAGFTDEERFGFSQILDSGFVDTFRLFNQEPGNYTWWSYLFNSRARNIGWRLDYFCASQQLQPQIKESLILPHIWGSDHCPVSLILEEI